MKRIITLLLTLCLALGGGCIARADEADALRVIDGWSVCEAYAAQYPDRKLDIVNEWERYDDDHPYDEKALLLSGEWDVAMVETGSTDLKALYDAGLLADLSGDEAIAARAAGMYGAVRGAVTLDGKLIGMPMLMFGLSQHMGLTTETDVLDQLGFTEADKPSTFAELAELCDRYMALDDETRRGTTFLGATDVKPSAALGWLVEWYSYFYAADSRQPDGRVDFDTDTFREGIAQCEHIAEALKSKKTLYKKGDSTLYYVICDRSNHWFEGVDSGLCVMTSGAEKKCPATMDVLVVNAKSPRLAQAVEFVRATMTSLEWTGAEMLEQPDYDALARASYDRDIQAQIDEGEDQSVIDELVRERDSGDYRRFYPQWTLDVYRTEIAPYLTFPYAPYFDAFNPAQDYAAGKMDVAGLVERLTAELQSRLE